MYKHISEIDLEWLKKNHQMIHYFGLGFIQLKITDRFRLHFYSDKLPPIVDEDEVHNHRYGFKSTILLGELSQEVFNLTSGETHTVEQDNCQEGFKMEKPPQPCGIQFIHSSTYATGSSYVLTHEVFHRVKTSKNCITLLDRLPYQKDLADIVRKKDSGKVCPFSQKITESDLLNIV
jgi:hypothetical protein